jgi:hypothetical protein
LHEGCTIAFAGPLGGTAWDGINEATSLAIQRISCSIVHHRTHRRPAETGTAEMDTKVGAPRREGHSRLQWTRLVVSMAS